MAGFRHLSFIEPLFGARAPQKILKKVLTTFYSFVIIDLSNEREEFKKLSEKKFLVVDTETCNTIEQPLPYDIGWVICDRYGQIYEERSFVVAETFCDMKDVMKNAYFAEKIPQYWEDIKNGTRTLATMWTIRKTMLEDMKFYNVKSVGAYNMGFDKRALNNLMRYVSKSWCRWWFPFGTEFFCIWAMACSVLLDRVDYIKFALQNGLVSEADNIQTSAECAFRYLTRSADFVESHTGLEDVKSEVKIMAECYKQHRKMEREINPSCWRIVQRKRKEFDLRAVFN